MSSSQVPLMEQEEARAAAEAAGVPSDLARLNVFRALLRRPRLAKAFGDLVLSMMLGGALDARLRELVIMRIGWASGSEYEWTQHWALARDMFGCSDDDLLAVRSQTTIERLGVVERAVLRAVDETLESGCVTTGTLEECRHHLGSDEAVLELVSAIGAWTMASQLLRSLRIPLEPGVEPWPPDGRAGPG